VSGASGDGDSRLRVAARRVVTPFVDRTVAERVVISLAAILLSVAVGFVIVLASGRVATCETAAWTMPLTGLGFCYDPVEVYVVLFNGALGYPFAVGDPGVFDPSWTPFNLSFGLTLSETTLLVFTGLSVAVAFRAGLFNIGTQGQLVVGALATALTVLTLAPVLPAGPLGGVVLVAAGTLAGAVGGGVWGAVPGALKAYADANEVITTIMLNFVAANVAYVLVLEVFRAEGSSVVATAYVPEYARVTPWLFPGSSDFALAVLFAAVGAVTGLYYLLEHTAFGYDLRTSGIQAALGVGVDVGGSVAGVGPEPRVRRDHGLDPGRQQPARRAPGRLPLRAVERRRSRDRVPHRRPDGARRGLTRADNPLRSHAGVLPHDRTAHGNRYRAVARDWR
jgi:simple sugar transport system permease protein